jgi:translation elongation factor EF-Tu-like GTPase
MGHEEAVLHGRRLGMNKEIFERPKTHVNIGTIVYPGMSPKTVSAQDLIEEARKARELDERQEA